MLFNKLTSNCSNKKFFIFLPVQRPPGGLELRNLEAYPKNLKSGGNSSYKNDFIPNNLSSQSKDKAYTHRLRESVRTSPPPVQSFIQDPCDIFVYYSMVVFFLLINLLQSQTYMISFD